MTPVQRKHVLKGADSSTSMIAGEKVTRESFFVFPLLKQKYRDDIQANTETEKIKLWTPQNISTPQKLI